MITTPTLSHRLTPHTLPPVHSYFPPHSNQPPTQTSSPTHHLNLREILISCLITKGVGNTVLSRVGNTVLSRVGNTVLSRVGNTVLSRVGNTVLSTMPIPAFGFLSIARWLTCLVQNLCLQDLCLPVIDSRVIITWSYQQPSRVCLPEDIAEPMWQAKRVRDRTIVSCAHPLGTVTIREDRSKGGRKGWRGGRQAGEK